MFCTNCGQKLSDNSTVCNNCGVVLNTHRNETTLSQNGQAQQDINFKPIIYLVNVQGL